MVARALYRGPAHVIVDADEEFRRTNAGRSVLGVPAREAFTEHQYRAAQALMDAVYLSGVPASLPVLDATEVIGMLRFEPVYDEDGTVWGLVSEFRPLAALRPIAVVPGPVPDRLVARGSTRVPESAAR